VAIIATLANMIAKSGEMNGIAAKWSYGMNKPLLCARSFLFGITLLMGKHALPVWE